MECSEPGAIRDEELLAYMAGEKVHPAISQHIAHCPRCASQLATYRRMEGKLTSRLYRWDCPPSAELGEFHLGLLGDKEAAKISSHLRRCTHCAAELATLTQFLANDPWLVEQPAPQRLVGARSSSNHHAVREAVQGLRQAGEDLKRIVATLIAPQPRFAFSQRIQQTPLWPRNYSADEISISIQLEQSPARTLKLIGFVTRKGTTVEALKGTPVQLLLQNEVVGMADTQYTQQIDGLGNFIFDPIAPATYTLELQLTEQTIVITSLEVAPL